MTITQLPYAICEHCGHQWILADKEKQTQTAICPNCGKRNSGPRQTIDSQVKKEQTMNTSQTNPKQNREELEVELRRNVAILKSQAFDRIITEYQKLDIPYISYIDFYSSVERISEAATKGITELIVAFNEEVSRLER